MAVYSRPETPVTQQEVVMVEKTVRLSVRKMNISGVVMYSGLTLPLKSRTNSIKSVASSPNVIAVNKTVGGFDVLPSGMNRLPVNKVKQFYK